ncbi:two-component system, NarL family, nitrate/nitrite sensor histidine kinase NarX [Planctomycetaceae bacterium]|nr:two-component system, NarL family, nitrate/nitrite sensor histidine kinase NarX [Planctomycetaceae bacterium]
MSTALTWFLTLRGRLVLLVCISTLPAMLFTFYAANNERSAAAKRMEEEARHLAVLASREHRQQFEGAHNLLLQLGEMLRRQGDLAPFTGNPEFLPALLAGFPQFANIGVLSAQGDVLGSAYPIEHPASWRDNPAFARALTSNYVETGQYVVGLIVGRPVVQLAYAVRAASGAVRSVLFVALDLKWLDRLARQVRLPPDYALVIADRESRVLAQGGELRDEPLAAGSKLEGVSGLQDGATTSLLKLSENGPRRLFVGERMEGVPGVTVRAGLPFERVVAEADFAFFRTLGALALLTLFTVGAALFAADVSVLRSLRGLSRAARRFGEGELQTRAHVSRGAGEMRELAQAFNSMAGALEARHRESLAVQDQLRALSQRLQLTRENEAGRIARELHDELGQMLTALKLDLAALRRRCGKEGNSSCVLALDVGISELGTRIDGAIDCVRRVSSELRPTVLDRLGLAAALEWQAREIEARTELTVLVDIKGLGEQLPWLVAVTLFRIAQEALTNVVRHAQAKTVWLEVSGDAQSLELVVRDDGRGISDTDEAASLGVLGMKERANLVGGEFSLVSTAGKGTTVRVRIARQPKEAEHAFLAG